MLDSKLAPIVLFVYNRPWHTRLTLEALMANELAENSRLIIYCDGPKPDTTSEQLQKINEVRSIIREKKWCSIVEIFEGEINQGLSSSEVSGITQVINKYGKIIVLEDDLITSPFFLKYMNESLILYDPLKNIYSVNGFMFPLDWEENHSILLPYTSTWGWGTWKDRWDYFDIRMPEKESIQENIFLKQRFNLGDLDYTGMLNYGNNSWGIKWYYSVFRNNGLGVFPTKSLVKNIGFDGSGENCGILNLKIDFEKTKPDILLECSINMNFFNKYLFHFKKPSLKLYSKLLFRIYGAFNKNSK